MPELEIKHMKVKPNIWEKVVAMAKRPENQRGAGSQAGMILEEYFSMKEKGESIETNNQK